MKNANDNQLTTFKFPVVSQMGGTMDRKVRVVTVKGKPWFVGADVCAALSITNASNAYVRLSPTEKTNIRRTEVGMGPGRDAALISESGLYKLVMRSDKPEARQFQDWVTREVLPAIRKDGAYVMGEEKVRTGEMSEDELILKAVSILQNKVERLTQEKEAALAENGVLKPKADKFDDFLNCDDTYASQDAAEILGLLGARELHKFAQEQGLITPRKDACGRIMHWNVRKAYAQSGYTKTKTNVINGHKRQQLRWTAEGVAFLADLKKKAA